MDILLHLAFIFIFPLVWTIARYIDTWKEQPATGSPTGSPNQVFYKPIFVLHQPICDIYAIITKRQLIVTMCASYLCRYVTMCVQRPAHLLLADNPAALLQPHSAYHHLAGQSFEHATMFYLVCHFCLDFTDVAVKDMYQLMMPKGGCCKTSDAKFTTFATNARM